MTRRRDSMRLDVSGVSVLVVCSCGWRSAVQTSTSDARLAALAHHAETRHTTNYSRQRRES
jgi:G:T-mismatch repair DNA endonuclease (very short patch repair protein)